jgi:glycine/D-amino acid oxidase-like deaminating enzyme
MFPALSTCGAPFDLDDPDQHGCVPGDAFLFETDGGYADPVGANQDLIEAARRRGVAVEFDSQVTALLEENGRVTGVRLSDGSEISAGLVINASGPWCNRLNEMAGAELRWTLTPTRVQTVYRTWPPELGPIPVVADNSTGIYFRPQSGGQQVILGSVLPEDEEEIVDDPDEFKRVPDAEFSEIKLAAFQHRVPTLATRGQVSGVAGLYTINREDVHPVVGPTGVDGFWVANGFSGHGFKLAPAVGSMVAQAYTGRSMVFDTDVPMSFFSVDREPIEVAVRNVLA